MFGRAGGFGARGGDDRGGAPGALEYALREGDAASESEATDAREKTETNGERRTSRRTSRRTVCFSTIAAVSRIKSRTPGPGTSFGSA